MLTDVALRGLKPRAGKFMVSDGGGLQLHVMPTGTKLWRLAYRFVGKPKTLSIGPYPTVGLAAAREARDGAKKQLAQGIDPSSQKRVNKLALKVAVENTFKAVAEEFRQKLERDEKAPVTLAKARWILEDLVYPFIGNRPITEIKPLEVLDVLRRVEGRGHFETASRTRRICSQVFRYAVATGRADGDPCTDLRGAITAPRNKPRAAITESKAIGQLLRAIDGYEGQGVTSFALRLAPLVFLRPAELRQAEWKEFDLASATWRVPAERMKMRREHIVPLSRQSLDILNTMKKLTGQCSYVFTSAWGSRRPISENTLNGALRRLGYEKEEMCSHGFRRMASTQLHEQGFNSEWVERQLAHVDGSVRGIYNAAQYLDGRRQMMQWWADHLDKLKSDVSLKS